MKTALISMLTATALAGCTTIERMNWVGVGGSKADGAVVLGIEVPPKMGISETEVQWDAQQANAEAARRCKNWGYAGAEVFNSQLPVQIACHPQGLSPCWSKTYRIVYQCVDERYVPPPPPPAPSI
jgi:hypothetical protein